MPKGVPDDERNGAEHAGFYFSAAVWIGYFSFRDMMRHCIWMPTFQEDLVILRLKI
jgi:hypothetical protein